MNKMGRTIIQIIKEYYPEIIIGALSIMFVLWTTYSIGYMNGNYEGSMDIANYCHQILSNISDEIKLMIN